MTGLLTAERLTKHYLVGGGILSGQRPAELKAVSEVSFNLETGETFALVGESGSGKTTIAKLLLGLETPTKGRVLFGSTDLATLRGTALRDYRRTVQAVFQDPYSSLNPRLKIRVILAEPVWAQRALSRRDTELRMEQVLDVVGLPRNARQLYPHEFSGGQRQRIAIARALMLRPRCIILDEPTSALDVSIRAQILNLLTDIQAEFGLTYLIIAHDLALVEQVATRVGVMYLGSLVEEGPTEAVFSRPRHPYTQALLAAVPRPDPDAPRPRGLIRGEIASAFALPAGCRFHPRCPHAFSRCSNEPPQMVRVGQLHDAACHLLTGQSGQPERSEP
jgi:oligopeptide/dipeptide ABC transporter ATP-binding protein